MPTVGQQSPNGRPAGDREGDRPRPSGPGPRVAVLSPPFYSHARPLSVLGRELCRAGADVLFASGAEFASLAKESGLAFRVFESTSNRNTGVAGRTRQGADDRDRLRAFLDATRQGAVPTLLLQSRHRRADMLNRPLEVLEAVRELHREVRPDWYLVDQLSYPVTLALHCLGLPFATYCPGHPGYIPADGQLFGVPGRWPGALRPDAAELAGLRETAAATEERFTAAFNEVVAASGTGAEPVGRAFALASGRARLFTYPRPSGAPAAGSGAAADRDLYQGHCTVPERLSPDWRARLAGLGGPPRVLVALGTFLSARDDVLRTVVAGVRAAAPAAAIVVAAGENAGRLADLVDERTVVEPFVPQRALLPSMDLMVHHGGNNSFTECLRAGVPALVLPFSSDQFAIAADAESLGVGRCADPNRATPRDISDHAKALLGSGGRAAAAWSRRVRRRGPSWGARRLLQLMSVEATAPPGAPEPSKAPSRAAGRPDEGLEPAR
ncbi:glycosyltransferase [Streptomyces sp. NPDC020141]|uniref:glycosyltransferase n=1 Tax=Streptomyces sp. NPDC020141 TaxID=3365065 RepID=UPI0037A3EC31